MIGTLKKISLAVLIFVIAPKGAHGATGGSTGSYTLNNPIKYDRIEDLVAAVLGIVSKFGAIIAVFFVIYSGFLFVTAGDSDEKLEKAKRTLLWTVVGAVIVIGAFAISEFIKNTARGLGVDIRS